ADPDVGPHLRRSRRLDLHRGPGDPAELRLRQLQSLRPGLAVEPAPARDDALGQHLEAQLRGTVPVRARDRGRQRDRPRVHGPDLQSRGALHQSHPSAPDGGVMTQVPATREPDPEASMSITASPTDPTATPTDGQTGIEGEALTEAALRAAGEAREALVPRPRVGASATPAAATDQVA